MSNRINPHLKEFSRNLRQNMTEEEKRLWYCFLKQLPVTVHRQKVLGKYIVDFYCAEAKVIIELDGSQHYTINGSAADTVRDAYFHHSGYQVLRYSNYEVNHSFDSVCQDIWVHIEARR